MHEFQMTSAPGNHRKLCVATLQIELADHAVMPLLYQERSRPRLEPFLDQLEFAFAEP